MITTGQRYLNSAGQSILITATGTLISGEGIQYLNETTGHTGVMFAGDVAKMTTSLEAQLTEARTLLQNLISQGLGGGADHARLERRINALKTRIMRQTAENASVAASADSLARSLNITMVELVKTLGKGAGPATRLSARERAVLRTVYGR